MQRLSSGEQQPGLPSSISAEGELQILAAHAARRSSHAAGCAFLTPVLKRSQLSPSVQVRGMAASTTARAMLT